MDKIVSVLAAALAVTVFAMPAAAYIGPGAGIGAIGTFFAVIGAVVLLIVGFLWYPIKRLLRKNKAPVEASAMDTTESASEKQ